MASTRRKRRTKHRGNAAGVVEARGRTGRAPTPQERKKSAGPGRQRVMKPPSWNGAISKALVMSVLLFALTQIGVFGKHVPMSQSFILAAFALILYTPLAYVTDKFVYQRQQRRLGNTGKR
jgi:drug/metabolite transporter (DMT)-like permease